MERFKVVILENEFYVDEFVANHIVGKIKELHSPVIGFDAANTLGGCYENLISLNKNGEVTFHKVKAFNLFEFIGVDSNNTMSYIKRISHDFYSKVNLKGKNIFSINGKGEYPEDECIKYEELLKKNPIDLQLIGVDSNGSMGYNQPYTNFQSKTQVIEIEHKSIIDKVGISADVIEDIPTKGITMGIGTIMKANELLIVAKGKDKSQVVRDMVQGKIEETFPLSVVRKHPNVIIVLDREAAIQLNGLYNRR